MARDGNPEHVHFEETDATLAVGWKGNYQIDASVYIDRDTARVTTIPAIPTRRLAEPS